MIDDIYTDPDSIFALHQFGLVMFVEVDSGGEEASTGASVIGGGGAGGGAISSVPIITYTPVGGRGFKFPEELE